MRPRRREGDQWPPALRDARSLRGLRGQKPRPAAGSRVDSALCCKDKTLGLKWGWQKPGAWSSVSVSVSGGRLNGSGESSPIANRRVPRLLGAGSATCGNKSAGQLFSHYQ